jgi:hypothetical protein
MKSVKMEKLVDLCDEMPDLDALKAWAQGQIAEEQAKQLAAGDLIELDIPLRGGGTKTVKAKPIGEHFALHNSGLEDYQGRGSKTLTHKASGLAVKHCFRAPLRDVVEFMESAEAQPVDWSRPDPLKGISQETTRTLADAARKLA